jgi:hypothetical protein
VIALGANPVEKELMAGCTEAARELRLEWDAPVKFIQLSALIALEMMVMIFSSNFISRRITGNLYRLQPALIHERLNVSINRSLAESRVITLRPLQNFVWREWPVGFDEGIADGCLLPCIDLSFHRNCEHVLISILSASFLRRAVDGDAPIFGDSSKKTVIR